MNLLWSPVDKALTVIDHNNAFDREFDEHAFFKNHVFRAERTRIPASFLLEQKALFEKMTDRFESMIQGFPECWVERDDLPGDFDPETTREILNRYDKIPDVFGGQE